MRIDSAQLDKEVTKVISRELPNTPGGGFDPYKTVVSTPSAAPPSQPAKPPVAPPPPPRAAIPPVTPPAAESQVTSSQAPTMSSPAGEAGRLTLPPAAAAPVAMPPSAPAPPQMTSAQTPPVSSSAAGEAGQVTLPPPSAQASSAAAVGAGSPVQPKKKRSKLPLIFGILLVLLLLGADGAVAGYFFVLKPMLAKKHIAVLEPRRQPTPNIERTPDVRNTKTDTPKIGVPPYTPPNDAVKFVNSSAKLTGKLAEHFVDFTFYYPETWYKDPEAGTAKSTNFAKVQRQLAPNAPQEIFAVGWYGSTGAKDTDEASYPRLVAERSAQFAKTYPEYQKVSEGPAKAGPYDAYEFHFTGVYRNTDRGDVKIWGRVMFVPPNEGTRGVTLLMLASSLAPEVKSVNDVGEKGKLPMALESFRFGK